MKKIVMLKLIVVGVVGWVNVYAKHTSVETADTVFINGRIYTLNEAEPWVEAVAIKEQRYVAVGTEKEVKQWIGPTTMVIDLKEKMAMPGINDAHTHLYGGLKSLYYCNFDPSSNLTQIKIRLQQCVEDNPEQKMIMGGYWVSSFFDDNNIESPKAWLDQIVGADVSVILSDDSGHNVWVNSAALKEIGYKRDTIDPLGGTILRDKAGDPTGLLYEVAAQNIEAFFQDRWPQSARVDGLKYTISEINRYGITGIKDASTGFGDLQALYGIDKSAGLTAHVATSLFTPYGPRNKALDYDFYDDLSASNASVNLHTKFIKFFLDGVPTSSRSAAMLAPYKMDHKHTGSTVSNTGMLHLQGELLVNDLIELDKRGFTIKLHAAGDRSVRVALDAIEKMRKANNNQLKMHEIAHAGFISDADLSRFEQLNVAADISPYLWFPSPIIDNIVSVLGSLGQHYFPNRKLLQNDATIIAGSDWPSVSLTPNPWPGIEATVTRKNPFKESADIFWPEQRLSLEETLKIFTVNGAKALTMEGQTGAIKLGLFADFIVLKDNLFEIPKEKISDTVIEQTWFKGEQVWSTSTQ